ncbi:DUF2501 domain-containing protein [Acetobacter syzygii]|uniref:DUF2501 domain-containing protein n=1 Tax=Acetobacter syzygii TaxID=146476 RepID=A0A270BW36_9PROT|nr:DUF2501 domain-containing protein [Acetobacter syzygii]PAL27095.1 DUF2501 domain-containing protein [Acetobacter syzygii]PAL29189.1 DUF2501 domain-containing protein [Acetobacter syzygii]GAN71437.1 hypothetical protein Absy_019_003 [Acetobacter syzygii]GBR65018.1 hypothetical protein AA0483_1650 [Acetobacter syzygii NRIC 0483]GEL56381.1 hypothetical protein ASY01nite_14470 [Acetobacter syzygii]
MTYSKTALLASAFILALGGVHVAQAQTVAAELPAGTTTPTPPPGALLATNPANPASAPTNGAQIINNVTGTTTATTPGALGENGLPDITHASAGNVAGLLTYCIHKNYVSGTTPRSVARTLAKRPDVKNDPHYSIGGQGLLQNGTSTPFDVATLDQSARVKLCSDLTKKGQSLLP